MADQSSAILSHSQEALAVGFIEDNLPRHHPAFANHSLQYDPVMRQFVPKTQSLVPNPNDGVLLSPDSPLPPRPAWADTNAMKFWNEIFPEAMVKFKSTTEPKGRSKTAYSIRDKNDWDAIYSVLEAARAKFQSDGGPVGWLRKVRRKAADNVTPLDATAKIASKMVPESPFSTPVVGAVEVLLDAVKTAATVRKRVLTGFDDIIPLFSDIEVFLGTFPNDPKIRTASVDLIAATVDAIERAIGFFISNEILRGGKALLSGGDYEKSILESLDKIKSKGKSLMEEAVKSHIHDFSMYSRETRALNTQVVRAMTVMSDGLTHFHAMLVDHLVEIDRKLELALQQNINLRVENGILRASSPAQRASSPLPSPPMQVPAMEWFISQDALRRILDSPGLDAVDVAFVDQKKHELPERQRVLVEQIIHTRPFRNWIVSPSSAKILVHWGSSRSKTVAGVSPLSVFCVTIARVLRAKDRFISLLWFCGRRIAAAEGDDSDDDDGVEPPPSPSSSRQRPIGGRAMLASLIDQLLQQHAFDTRPLHQHIDVAALQAGQSDTQMRLLDWLVRQLPPTTTLVCMVDGVGLLEREEYESEALPVLLGLLKLARDETVAATVKVLFTSVPYTDVVSRAFQQEDQILTVDARPLLTTTSSQERTVRELGGGLVELDEEVVEI